MSGTAKKSRKKQGGAKSEVLLGAVSRFHGWEAVAAGGGRRLVACERETVGGMREGLGHGMRNWGMVRSSSVHVQPGTVRDWLRPRCLCLPGLLRLP